MDRELVNLTPAERQEILHPASVILTSARACTVVDDVGYAEAGDALKGIKAAQKALEIKKRKLLDPVNATLRAIRELFEAPEHELKEAEGLYKRQLLSYEDAQERRRKEEQRLADERAAAERRRLEKEAEETRARAAAAAERGQTNLAERLTAKADLKADAATATVAPVVQIEPPRVSDVVSRENWSAVVTDLKALVAAVAAGTVPLLAIEANMKFLNNQAKAMKKDLPYPGVTAVVEKIMAAGSK